MPLRSTCWVLLLIQFVCIESLQAQTYVADTITARFRTDSVLKFHHTLHVEDSREESPRFISIYEKKKWLFFPVDQVVQLAYPLAVEFERHISSNKGDSYHLDIHEFNIDHNETMFNRSLQLNGTFQLSGIHPFGDTVLLGSFYYENISKYRKKIEIGVVYSEALNDFKSEFIRDLNTVCPDTMKTDLVGMYHFREGSVVAPKNFYVSTDVYYGFVFWGFDAELYFSPPEPSRRFDRKSRMFRYLNYKNRQSVGFAPRVYYLNHRLSDKWLFQNKSAFLLGFNRWEDIDEESRTLEEILLFQFSMMQRITLNKLDRSGLVFGIGIMEEASYVIYNRPMLNVGLVLNIEYKF